MPLFKSFRASTEQQTADGRTARTVVQVTGEVDVATSPLLAAAVARAMESGTRDRIDLVVDLAQVRFIDASGINVLVNAAHQARAAGGTLALRSPSRSVRRMLGILKLDGVLAAE
jgi:anti-anti-sigma factor